MKKAATTRKKTPAKKARAEVAESYEHVKEYEGREYTGMQIGRSHKWKYDAGEWRETKITPELWHIQYAVTKRRAGHAPNDSGAPVGTGYHWYIVAHQNVHKLNADDYSTAMTGLKFKVAHKRATSEKWSASAKTQRKHMVAFLKEVIAQLQQDPVPLEFEYNGVTYKGEGIPIMHTCEKGMCRELDITLNDAQRGIIRKLKSGWKMNGEADTKLVKAIGKAIDAWYGV